MALIALIDLIVAAVQAYLYTTGWYHTLQIATGTTQQQPALLPSTVNETPNADGGGRNCARAQEHGSGVQALARGLGDGQRAAQSGGVTVWRARASGRAASRWRASRLYKGLEDIAVDRTGRYSEQSSGRVGGQATGGQVQQTAGVGLAGLVETCGPCGDLRRLCGNLRALLILAGDQAGTAGGQASRVGGKRARRDAAGCVHRGRGWRNGNGGGAVGGKNMKRDQTKTRQHVRVSRHGNTFDVAAIKHWRSLFKDFGTSRWPLDEVP
ncbi:hypothetical protein GGX14DRAFT_390876 [Mycena pura]|uniref:Uncharacterized protein n=1 Tax=Mycena pura TaxID=153505 RepID=A0AAD6YH52_9AGAR|nr:hypothetical protein GGX14DRAFT_390876 [Mycena pura]